MGDRIASPVLDAGCGTGDNALFFAGRGCRETGTQGPRRVSKKELHGAFAEGWGIESVEPVQAEVRPDPKDLTFSAGGPKAWFVVARRA